MAFGIRAVAIHKTARMWTADVPWNGNMLQLRSPASLLASGEGTLLVMEALSFVVFLAPLRHAWASRSPSL